MQGVREEPEQYSRKCILIRSFIRASIWPRSAISSFHGLLSGHSYRRYFTATFLYVGYFFFLLNFYLENSSTFFYQTSKWWFAEPRLNLSSTKFAVQMQEEFRGTSKYSTLKYSSNVQLSNEGLRLIEHQYNYIKLYSSIKCSKISSSILFVIY